MPIFNDRTMETSKIRGTNYGFSARRVSDLGACEYTLVGVAADVSGSVAPFLGEIEACVAQVVEACRKSPRADNLMLRLVAFASTLDEVHGFKPLTECNPADYSGALARAGVGGTTALYDATHNGVEALRSYAETLNRSDFDVNGIVFVITDGCDNHSTLTAAEVKKAMADAVRGEDLESVVSVLVGVNIQDRTVSKALLDFSARAGFTQYVEIANADAGTLARLARFVSRSVSSQSQSLGSGQASPALTF